MESKDTTVGRLIIFRIVEAVIWFWDDLLGVLLIMGSGAWSVLIVWMVIDPAGALAILRDLTPERARELALLVIVVAFFLYLFSNAFSAARHSFRRARRDRVMAGKGVAAATGPEVTGAASSSAGGASMGAVSATVHKAATAKAEGESEATADASVEKAGDGQQKTE